MCTGIHNTCCVRVRAGNCQGRYDEAESQGRYDEALPLYVDCLEAYRRVLGAEHPSTLASMNNLDGLYKIQGRYIPALTATATTSPTPCSSRGAAPPRPLRLCPGCWAIWSGSWGAGTPTGGWHRPRRYNIIFPP